MTAQCVGCGVPVNVQPYRLRANPNRRCMGCYRATLRHTTRHGEGYVLVGEPGRGRSGKRELEHRRVAAATLGRPLLPKEVVHHLNHDRTDNRPENLVVCANAGVHIRDYHPEAYEKRWARR